jgi:hypothetical protein
VWIHDILLERANGEAIDLETLAEPLKAGFLAVWYGQAENDGFNTLIASANLPWRDVAMLRALARYLRQALLAFSPDYVWETLIKHEPITTSLVDLFHARLDPRKTEAERDQQSEKIAAAITMALEDVSSLDEDTILRRFLNLISRSFARTSSNLTKTANPSQPLPSRSIQRMSMAARAAAIARNLGLFAARGRRASARRDDRPWRSALVGSSAGFPHRGARPCQSAAGEERRHRAVRRQGRVRAQAVAAARRSRSLVCRRHGGLQDLHLFAARCDRQSFA